VTDVPLEFGVASDFLRDDSADPPSFRIPAHVVTDIEHFRHGVLLKPPTKPLLSSFVLGPVSEQMIARAVASR
jgi:hypothetical protein